MTNPFSAAVSPALTGSARLLLVGGFLLVVAGLVTGEVFALLLSHRLNADLRAAWLQVLAAGGDVGSILSRFEEIHRLATDRARAMSLHSHFGPYGLLAASLALAKTRLGRPGTLDFAAAVLILAGGLLQSLGFLALDYNSPSWLSLSSIGVLSLILGIALYLPGLFPKVPARTGVPTAAEPGGRLTRIGAALVFAGLLFGLWLAWRHVFFEEPALHAALRSLVAALAAGDADAAQSLYATYKSTQVRMAITAASHSHAVAFGFIMLVAGLAAAHLRLGRGWRNAAFLLIAAGSLLLPVFVYLAPRYGYVFALFADSAGGLVILGLLILVVGLLRPERLAP